MKRLLVSNALRVMCLIAVFGLTANSRLLAQTFGPEGIDSTMSLGSFRIAVKTKFHPLMSGYPGWDATTQRVTSPPISDAEGGEACSRIWLSSEWHRRLMR